MKEINNVIYDEERALYGQIDLVCHNCKFDGPKDGESAFKEGRNISVDSCFFNLRYPFWHDEKLSITNSMMTELCRAALWYSKDITIENTKLHGIKALRECEDVKMINCDVISSEFGWSTSNITMDNCTIESEYFMLRGSNLNFRDVKMRGKYSFQYIDNSSFENCEFDTKDAFWHAHDIVIKNSVVKGEYLAWYSENITFENCTIIGTQPLCYCKGLKLINCKMNDTDLAFEYSDVEADIIGDVLSIKNPKSGSITIDSAKEIILENSIYETSCVIKERKPCSKSPIK